jgi:tRNA 2-thiouridine synthesizing protein A
MKKDEKIYNLDVCGLLCPLPVIKTQDFVGDLKNNDILQIIASDKGVLLDIPVWCKINNHKFLGSYVENNKYYLKIKIKHNDK